MVQSLGERLEQDGGWCFGLEVLGNVLATLRDGKEMDIGVLFSGSSTLNNPSPDSISSGLWGLRGNKSPHLCSLGLIPCERVPV